jgi:cation transport regulator ChaC
VNDAREAAKVWYFGYGSNMDSGTFLGRRRMRPAEARVGVLADWRLCFDLPIGRGERGMANVRPVRGAEVWGVLWRITPSEAAHLDRTEGVPQGAYVRAAVRVGDRDGAVLEAFTYRSWRGRPGRKPSRRYMGLLLAGARYHGLPEDYVAWLRSLELARDEREPQQGRLL